MVTSEELRAALAGVDPPTGREITAEELGRQLAAHRRRQKPYTASTITVYLSRPEMQSREFGDAFASWKASKRLKAAELSVRYGDELHEMLDEVGHVVQVGEAPWKAVVVVGRLPAGTLISVNGVARAVEVGAAVVLCECGRLFVQRSWNHVRCSACRAERRRTRKGV